MITTRFTLRKEYFGGILHDAQKIRCDVLDDRTYKMVAEILQADHITKHCGSYGVHIPDLIKYGYDRAEIMRFVDMGALEIMDNDYVNCVYNGKTRLVRNPIIPQHCLSAPLRVYDTYTRQCNLDCPQCCLAASKNADSHRRTLGQTMQIMDKFYLAGTMEWRFTGGEATSCDDLPQAIAYAKSLGMAVMLNTNGCWSEQVAKDITDAGVDEVIISLEGTEETNDKRRNLGTFSKIMWTFDFLDHYNRCHQKTIGVTINMTVARDNAIEMPYVASLAAQHGYNLNFVPLRPYGRSTTGLPDTMLSTEEYMEFCRAVQQTRETTFIRESGIKIIHKNMDCFSPDYPDKSELPYPFNYSDCGALSTGFGLCPDGSVNACSFLMDEPEFKGPNLIDTSVQEAWLHPSMEHFRNTKKVGCHGCRFYMKQCEGKCRAMVIANGGRIENSKLYGQDPYCYKKYL